MAKRELVPTLLVVGEGDSEEAFLRHIRQFPLCRRNGTKITIRNAHGKGAAHVTIMQFVISKNFIMMLSLFFCTDTDWNNTVRKKADK